MTNTITARRRSSTAALSRVRRVPSLFLAHGSPMTVIDKDFAGGALQVHVPPAPTAGHRRRVRALAGAGRASGHEQPEADAHLRLHGLPGLAVRDRATRARAIVPSRRWWRSCSSGRASRPGSTPTAASTTACGCRSASRSPRRPSRWSRCRCRCRRRPARCSRWAGPWRRCASEHILLDRHGRHRPQPRARADGHATAGPGTVGGRVRAWVREKVGALDLEALDRLPAAWRPTRAQPCPRPSTSTRCCSHGDGPARRCCV